MKRTKDKNFFLSELSKTNVHSFLFVEVAAAAVVV
jgi:hypothetical protein